MRRAFSRTSTPEEVASCAAYATKGLDVEADPHRRWAYVCASIMSSAGFLTY